MSDKPAETGRGIALATLAWGLVAGSAWAGADIDGDVPFSLLDAPEVLGLINDGDEAVTDTIYVYLDGCPVLSITPPPSGYGAPDIAAVEVDGPCRRADSTAVTPAHFQAVSGGQAEGLHVKLLRSDATDEETPSGVALVLDIASFYPDAPRPEGNRPRFHIPGIFGDPSGDLTLAAGESDPAVLFGTGGLAANLASSFAGSGDRATANAFDDGKGAADTQSDTTITAVPLPATLLLLLWALHMLRSRVRRQ